MSNESGDYPHRWSPFRFGIADGMGQPFYLSVGRTWTDDHEHNGLEHSDDPNDDYDLGVNVGQNIMRLLMGAL